MSNFNRSESIVLGIVTMALFVCCHCNCFAVGPSDALPSGSYHPLVTSHLPPGRVGQTRLQSQNPVAGYYQPIKFSGPDGTEFALPQGGAMAASEANLMAGLKIGSVYRFRVTGIPGSPGAELYPTVELIDRTYPPPGLATLYPIPINLDRIDLDAALDGQMVTRVIYLEDQQSAAPLASTPSDSRVIDVAYYQDPLETADRLGRPIAIVRIGSLAPPSSPELLPQFYFGYPMWAPIFQPEAADAGSTTATYPAVQP